MCYIFHSVRKVLFTLMSNSYACLMDDDRRCHCNCAVRLLSQKMAAKTL